MAKDKNDAIKGLAKSLEELSGIGELAEEIKELKNVIVDSNEELIATFVEGTKRILKKDGKDVSPSINNLAKSTTEGLEAVKKVVAEVERGVKAIKLPSNTDFRATGAMLKLPIKELTRAIQEKESDLPRSAKDPISVRLSDGENFYKALDQVIQQISGGGGSSYAFDTQGGSPTKAATVQVSVGGKTRDAIVVVNPDGTEVGGSAAGGGLTDAELRATPVPVSGTVAVTNAGLTALNGAISGTEVQVDVLTMPTVTVTATNLDVQSGGADLATTTQAGAIQTAVETIDNAVHVDDAAYTLGTHSGVMMMGFAGTQSVNANDAGAIAMETDGAVHIHDGGNTITVDGTVAVSGTVPVSQSGTWDEVGINDSGNSITVDYATTGSGTATGALRVELPTNGTGVIATVGAVTAITNALPAGTNAIGKLSANSGVDIGDVTLTANADVNIGSTKGLPSDIDINGSNANHAQKYYTNSGAVTDGIVWSPAAGKRWHVLTLYINVSAAATVTLEDDLAGGDSAVWKGELAANSGVILTYDKEHPFSSTEDAADLIITTSAGNVYVQAVGYEV